MKLNELVNALPLVGLLANDRNIKGNSLGIFHSSITPVLIAIMPIQQKVAQLMCSKVNQ